MNVVIRLSILLFVTINQVYSFSLYCSNYTPKENTDFKSIKIIFNEKIQSLSNHKLITSKADAVLSKLIQAKSPIITNWMKKRQLSPEKQELEIVLKWRRYYLENFLINGYPNKSVQINKLIDDIFHDINIAAFSKKRKNKFETIFNDAKLFSLKKIRFSNIPSKEKEQISNRLNGIKLYWFNKLKASKYEKMPLEFIQWGIAYDPAPNEINIGIEALTYSSEESLFSIFAHEIGHSIDPCRWGAFLKGNNPFNNVITCLRSKESANAQVRDDSLMNELVNKKLISEGLAESLKLNPTCNKTNYPPRGTQKDQISETFADWFSAETVALSKKYLKINLRKDLCQKKMLIEGSSYISNKMRLESIYFANPIIKSYLKVNSSYKYCKLK